MRLIDADSIIHLVTDSTILGDGFKTAFCALVNGEPTVKMQKTGKWVTLIDTNPYYTTWWYECSECGQKPLQDGYGQEVLSDYCPNCGARMEREEE